MPPQQRLLLPVLLLIFGNIHVARLLANCYANGRTITIAAIVFTFSIIGAAFLLAMAKE